jgi:hypothetical protein
MAGALGVAALVTVAASAQQAKSDDLLNHMVLSASGDSWNVWNATTAVRDDAAVKGGKATRITAKKGANPWDAQASITLPQAVAKGDIILVAYYARVETPPEGASTANIPSAGIGLNKAPYTGFASETAAPSAKWGVYYTSGTADADHSKGTLNFGVQLAAADQVIDLGPVFIFNLGPNWDGTKIPHNRIAAVSTTPAPAAAPASPDAPYAADLAKIRAKLPVKGTLINDPAQIYSYGPDVTASDIAASDVISGKAKRIVTNKPGAHPYDDGISSPVNAAIKKGDVIFTAVLVRASETSGTSANLPELGVHLAGAPYTAIATASATAPKGQWVWVMASGVATADYAAGTTGFGMQLGGDKQTLDIAAVYVLNLGPGVDVAKLPSKGL